MLEMLSQEESAVFGSEGALRRMVSSQIRMLGERFYRVSRTIVEHSHDV